MWRCGRGWQKRKISQIIMNKQIFFTIKKDEKDDYQFNSDFYSFTIKDQERMLGNFNTLWYRNFPVGNVAEFDYLAWKTNNNESKHWEYLVFKVKETTYWGYVNPAKQLPNTWYCLVKEIEQDKKDEFEIFI